MDFSKQDLTGFANKDKSIILNNPDATIYDLTLKGLSEKAKTKLEAMESLVQQSTSKVQAEQDKVIEPVKVEEPQETIAQPSRVERTPIKPVLSQVTHTAASPNYASVWLYNGNTGIKQVYSRVNAEKLVRQQPNIYKIIE